MRQNFFNDNTKKVQESTIHEQYNKIADYMTGDGVTEEYTYDPLKHSSTESSLNKARFVKQKRQEYVNGIATSRFNEIRNVLSSAQHSLFIMNKSAFSIDNAPKSKYASTEDTAFDIYKKAGTDVFKAVLDLNSENNKYFLRHDTSDLQYQRVSSPTVLQTRQQLLDGISNLKSKGKAVYWDTETFSGVNAYGKNEVDKITEFNFRVLKDTGSKINGRQWQTEHLYQSIIGISNKEYEEYLDIAKKYRGGSRVTEKERVILERLALTGHANTEVGAMSSTGVVNFSKFAGKEDIVGMSYEDITRGARRMRDIGIGQENAAKTVFGGHKVTGWEAELLGGLNEIIGNETTAIGHNTEGFDWPALNEFLKKANTSIGFKRALASIVGDKGIRAPYQIDMLAALRMSGVDRKSFYTPEQWSYLHDNNLTSFQQEALMHKYNPNFYADLGEGAAHMARTDTDAGAYIALETDLLDEKSPTSIFGGDLGDDSRFAKPITIKGGSTQLFMASKGGLVSDYGLWGFKQDAFSGGYRTVDGFSIDERGKVNKEVMKQYLFQKEVAYTPVSVSALKDAKGLSSMLGKLNPSLNADDFYAVTFMPVTNKEVQNIKSASPVTIAGPKDKMQQYINSMMYHVGDKNADGKWVMADDPTMLHDLSVYSIGQDGLVNSLGASAKNKVRSEKVMKYILENSAYRLQNESASRSAREASYKKDANILRFLDDMNAYATDDKGVYSKSKAKEFQDNVIKKSMELEKKIRAAKIGTVFSEEDLAGSYHDYFGYTDFSTGTPTVYSETIDAAIARQGQVEKNRHMYELAMEKARLRAGLDKVKPVTSGNKYMDGVSGDKLKLVDAYYQQYMKAFEDAAILANGEEVARNQKQLGMYAYQRKAFEVNMNGYKEISEDKIFRINLDGAGLNIANNILKQREIDPEKLSEFDKVAELRKFQKFMINNGVIEKPTHKNRNNFIAKDDSLELASQKIISGLREERKKNRYSGYLSSTLRLDVLETEAINRGLSDAQLHDIAAEADKTIPNIVIADEKNVAFHAKEITNNVLFGGQNADEIRKQLSQAGLSKKQIDFQLKARDVRLQDTKNFMTKFLSSMVKNGASIGYDQDNVFLMAGGKQLMLDNLPKDIFENNMFYTQVGRTKTAAPLGFFMLGGEKSRKLKFGSLIQKASDSVRSMSYILNDGAKRGELLSSAQYILGKFAKTLRESSSVAAEDAQDMKAGSQLLWGDLVEAAPQLGISEFATDDKVKNKILNAIIDSDGTPKHAEDLNNANRISVQSEANTFIKAAIQSTDAKDFFSIEDISYDTKHRAEFIATFDAMHDFGENLVSTKRGEHHQAARAVQFNKTYAQKHLKNHDVEYGQGIQTKNRATRRTLQNGVGYEVDTTVKVNRMAMATKDLRDLITSSNIDGVSLDMLSTAHLDEGAGIIDPELADRVFTYRNSMQKIALSKIFERDKEVIAHLSEKSKAAPSIKIRKDGSVAFSYTQGKYIKEGQRFISKIGYGDVPEEVQAKESGLFRLGVFTHDGKLVDEKSINALLKQQKFKFDATAEGKAAAKQAVLELLNKKYDLNYYIQGLQANTTMKLAEMTTEKGMMRAMMLDIGSKDARVAETLKNLGAKDLLHMTPDVKIIDSLKDRTISTSLFGTIVNGMSGKNMTSKEMESVILQNFDSIQDFHDSIMEERYDPWKKLLGAMRDKNLIGQDEIIHSVSNTIKAEKKHMDVKAAVNRITDNLLKKYNNDSAHVFSLLSNNGITGLVHDADSNSIHSTESTTIQLGKVNQLSEKEFGDSNYFFRTFKTTINGEESEHIADVSRVEYLQLPNFDRSRVYAQNGAFNKAIKLTHRATTMLGMTRYDDKGMERVKKGLQSALGEEAGTTKFNEVFGGYEANAPITQGLIDYIKDSVYVRPGEDVLARVGSDGKIVYSKDIVKKTGLSKDKVEAVTKVAINNGAKAISSNVVQERFSALSFATAYEFNKKGGLNTDLETLAKKNIPTIRMADVTVPNNGMDSLDFAESIYGQESLLDLHIDGSDKQLYDVATGNGRRIYIPYAPPKGFGDDGELAKMPFQKKVASLHRQITDYNAAIKAVDTRSMSEDEKDAAISRMAQTVNDIKVEIAKEYSGKKGIVANIARAHISDSVISTAYGHTLYGDETSEYMNKLNFDGVNLVEQAKKGTQGLDFDYTILSKQTMDKLYGEYFFHTLGMEDNKEFKDKLFKRLQSGGTIGMNIREPQDKMKSTSISAIYFSDVVSGDQALVSSTQHASQGGDFDSDKVETSIIKHDAYIKTKDNLTIRTKLDKAAFDVINDMEGFSASWADNGKAMKSHIATEYNNAYNNRLYAQKENYLNDSHLKSFATDHFANYTIEGTANGTLAPRMEATGEEAEKYRSLYRNLEEKAIKKYGSDFTEKPEDASVSLGAHQRSKIYEMLQQDTPEARAEGHKALHMHLTDSLNDLESTTGALKAAAGEMNYNLYGYLKIAQSSNAISADDFQKIANVHAALGEAFLSPKNESSVAIDQIDKFRDAMQNAYKAMAGGYNKDKAAEELFNTIMPTLKSRDGKEMAKLAAMLDPEYATNEKAPLPIIEDAARAYSYSVINNVDLHGTNPRAYDFGVTNGYKTFDKNEPLATGSDDILSRELDNINETARMLDRAEPIRKAPGAMPSRTAINNAAAPSASILNDREPMRYTAPERISATDVSRSIGKAIRDIHFSKQSGIGAGIAAIGGLLVSGYANNPSTPAPAETQAAGSEQEFQDMYSQSEVPSFSDSNMNSMRGGPKQGYVININAQTDNGRQQAVDAINSTIGGAIPQASSINVAMSTSYADKISQFQISKMLENAF